MYVGISTIEINIYFIAVSVKVRVDHPTKTWFEADVLHATPVDHVFDIGVLRIREYNPTKVRDNRITIATDIEEGL